MATDLEGHYGRPGESRSHRLGPYEILGLIGTGGMVEVYVARDPRLGRNIAIKLSAEHRRRRKALGLIQGRLNA